MPHKSLQIPAFIAPQIPVLSAEPLTGSGWIHEIKHDGFHKQATFSDREARN